MILIKPIPIPRPQLSLLNEEKNLQGISDGILKSWNYERLSYHLSSSASPQRGEKAHRSSAAGQKINELRAFRPRNGDGPTQGE